MPILTYAEYNYLYTVPDTWEAKINFTMWEMFLSGYHWTKYFQDIKLLLKMGVHVHASWYF